MTGELYEIEDLLNDLNIEIIESTTISDGDIDYFIFSSSNLEEEEKEIIFQLEFIEFRDNLFISEKINHDKNEILEIISPVYTNLEKEVWTNIIKKIHKINEGYLSKSSQCLFNLGYDHIIIPLEWNQRLTTNNSELGDLINDLNKLIRQSCKNNNRFVIDEKYKNHDFWKIISSLRNRRAHIATERGINGAIDLVNREKEAYMLLIGKESPDPNIPFDFINVQINLLEYCNNFLDRIIGDL